MPKWPWSNNQADIDAQIDSKVAAALEEKAAVTFTAGNVYGGVTNFYGVTGVEAAYQNSWIAYACIRRIAQDLAGVPLLYLSDPDDTDSGVPDSNRTKVMFLNPGPYFSTAELMQWIATFLNMRGEFFIPFDNPVRPTEMIPQTDPLYWTDNVEGLELRSWSFQQGPVGRVYMPDEVIHHGLVNPANPFRGQTPLMAASLPYQIETGSESLTEDFIAKGGQKTGMFQTDVDVTSPQERQFLASIRGRNTAKNAMPTHSLLPKGISPADAKFLDTDAQILEAGGLQPDKIAAVYGVPKSLLGYEDVDKFATFEGRKKMYWTNTILPLAKGITDAFDTMFIDNLVSAYRCYVRFDWSAVEALQDSLESKFEIAGKAHKDGIPWSVLNERFALGLDTSKIPGSDTILVSSTLAPVDAIIDTWENPPEPSNSPSGGGGGDSTEGDGKGLPLTNSLIRKRATNTREAVRRNQRMLKNERGFSNDWKVEVSKSGRAASKALGPVLPAPEDVEAAIAPAFKTLADRLTDVESPRYDAAALEGERAVIEIVEGKMSDMERDLWRKAHTWAPGTAALLRKRKNKTIPAIADDLFQDVLGAVERSVTEGAELSEVRRVLQDRIASAPGGLNRANTIARTELGTAFSGSKFNEIKNQDFKRVQWITNGDEVVREPPDSKFNHVICDTEIVDVGDLFPCGLTHPLEDGGDAGNVINCRCDIIPLVEAN